MTGHPLEAEDLAGLSRAVMTEMECEHLTILALYDRGSRAQRLYSTLPDVFPLQGMKELPDTPSRRHFIAGNAQLAAGAEELRKHHLDHETILDAGITAILNVPVRYQGEVIASVNCNYMANAPRPDRAAACDAMIAEMLAR